MSRGVKKGQDNTLSGQRCGVALSWDRGSKAVDLDLQAVAFTDHGKPLDAVYYNNLKALGRGLTHSGDEVTGAKQGYDEVVWVNHAKMPKNVSLIMFVVAAYQGGCVQDAANAKLHILQDSISNQLASFNLSTISGQAAVVGVIIKKSGSWILRLMEVSSAQGQHFIDILEPTIGDILRQILPKAPRRVKASFAMEKGSVVDLPMSASLRATCAGLAWDIDAGEVDLDVSAIQLDAAGQEVDTVFFGNLEGQGITHSGDNLTGEGGGDDEVITLNLEALAPKVQQIYFVINIYSKGKTFAHVSNPSCRIFEQQGGETSELCHYKLAEATDDAALIMARLFRAPGDVRWGFQAVGEPCRGRTWKDSLPQVIKHSAIPPKGSAGARQTSTDGLASPAKLHEGPPKHTLPPEYGEYNPDMGVMVRADGKVDATVHQTCGECTVQ